MHHSILRKTLLWLTALLVSVTGVAQGNLTGNNFGNEVALRGRHPEIVSQSLFRSWSEIHRIGAWHEARVGDGREVTVAIQGQDDRSVLAALVTASPATVRDGAKLMRLEAIEVSGAASKSAAISAVGSFDKEIGNQRPHAVRPSIDWSGPKAKLSWDIEFVSPTSRSSFSVDSGKVVRRSSAPLPPPRGGGPAPGTADDMASNELHHLADFRDEAMLWAGSASTVQDKARRIFQFVADNYFYDSTIVNIENFTWADSLVRDVNGRRGICDEWAVVEISYLRAVGIPARLKLMTWKDEHGKDAAHAALEYNDGGTWRHMDALWHAFNDPGVYRSSGATNVLVMDNDFPEDSKSTIPAWGVPDPTGDLKLYPYGDFIVNPAYPGDRRPGYSY